MHLHRGLSKRGRNCTCSCVIICVHVVCVCVCGGGNGRFCLVWSGWCVKGEGAVGTYMKYATWLRRGAARVLCR